MYLACKKNHSGRLQGFSKPISGGGSLTMVTIYWFGDRKGIRSVKDSRPSNH